MPIEQIFNDDTVWVTGDFQWGPNGSDIYGCGSVNQKPSSPYIWGTNSNIEIFSFDVNTGNILSRITHNSVDESGFKLSPHHDLIGFNRGNFGYSTTYHIINLINGETTELSTNHYFHPSWNWSSNGQLIVCSRDNDSDPFQNYDFQIFVLDISNITKQSRLTNFNAIEPDLFIYNQN